MSPEFPATIEKILFCLNYLTVTVTSKLLKSLNVCMPQKQLAYLERNPSSLIIQTKADQSSDEFGKDISFEVKRVKNRNRGDCLL